jgi:RHS repeat-associated protein
MTASVQLEQRFYTSQFGRFMSADRFQRSWSVFDSGSWNKYLYSSGDPVNRFDPAGQSSSCTDDGCGESDDPGDTVCDSNGTNC